jgi:hypothetical protein
MRHSTLAIAILFAAHLAAAAVAQTNPFLEAGVPATSRVWTGPDYTRAVEVLSAGKVSLPRFGDPQGAALLDRITSTENLSLQRNKNVELSLRLQDFLQVQQGATKLLSLYVNAKDLDYRPELTRIAAFILHSSAQGVDLAQEFTPTIPKDDTYATRMEGLKKMNDGLTRVFVGTEQMLSERNNLAPDDLSILLEAMAATLPRIKIVFPNDVRIELRKKLEADKARFQKEEDVRRLDRMIGELGA